MDAGENERSEPVAGAALRLRSHRPSTSGEGADPQIRVHEHRIERAAFPVRQHDERHQCLAFAVEFQRAGQFLLRVDLAVDHGHRGAGEAVPHLRERSRGAEDGLLFGEVYSHVRSGGGFDDCRRQVMEVDDRLPDLCLDKLIEGMLDQRAAQKRNCGFCPQVAQGSQAGSQSGRQHHALQLIMCQGRVPRRDRRSFG